jgi:hypothetical protein
MPVRLDQLARETRQQVLAALEEQGHLAVDDASPPLGREHAGHSWVSLRTAGIVLGYGALLAGIFLAFGQASATQDDTEFLASVGVYVVRELWAIVRENAVPLSGNLVIVIIFALGVFQAVRLALRLMLKLWPVLLALAGLGVALVILRLEGTQ